MRFIFYSYNKSFTVISTNLINLYAISLSFAWLFSIFLSNFYTARNITTKTLSSIMIKYLWNLILILYVLNFYFLSNLLRETSLFFANYFLVSLLVEFKTKSKHNTYCYRNTNSTEKCPANVIQPTQFPLEQMFVL